MRAGDRNAGGWNKRVLSMSLRSATLCTGLLSISILNFLQFVSNQLKSKLILLSLANCDSITTFAVNLITTVPNQHTSFGDTQVKALGFWRWHFEHDEIGIRRKDLSAEGTRKRDSWKTMSSMTALVTQTTGYCKSVLRSAILVFNRHNSETTYIHTGGYLFKVIK